MQTGYVVTVMQLECGFVSHRQLLQADLILPEFIRGIKFVGEYPVRDADGQVDWDTIRAVDLQVKILKNIHWVMDASAAITAVMRILDQAFNVVSYRSVSAVDSPPYNKL